MAERGGGKVGRAHARAGEDEGGDYSPLLGPGRARERLAMRSLLPSTPGKGKQPRRWAAAGPAAAAFCSGKRGVTAYYSGREVFEMGGGWGMANIGYDRGLQSLGR